MGINQEINDVSTGAGMTLAQMTEIVDEARQVEYYSQITQQQERRQSWPPGSSTTGRKSHLNCM
jgi:hypothetical protein